MPLIINGEPVDDTLIREEMRVMRPHLQEAMAGEDPLDIEMRLREWAKENVIERVLLRQAARKQPLEDGCVTPPSEEQLLEALVGRIAAAAPPLKPKQALEFYKKNKGRFDGPEQVRARHIVKNVDEQHNETSALEGIQKAEAELAGGADFAAVADRYSDCPGQGGDLGYFSRAEMVPEFENVVFAMNPGERSPIFRSPFGFHIALVVDRRAAGLRRFEEVRDQIENELLRQLRQKALEDYIDAIRATADVRDVRQKQA
jgi:parvulin-like peptidyl-prolyl isomerase